MLVNNCGNSVIVDDLLNETSENPIQNKVVKQEIVRIDTEVGKKADSVTMRNALDLKADLTYVGTELSKKVSTVAGKGLSTNDYITAHKDCVVNLTSSKTVVLPASGWITGVAPYVGWKTNRVNVPTALELPKTRVEVRSGANDPATAELDKEAYGLLYHVNTFDGYIIARALEVPTRDITIVIEGV